ncbi:hypothetical protein CRE_24997 [Caenorhabditis remanei]|uniref:Uncharacterized protein n=1 Tax=Caenorhabditis remanei TaxID=31234 RepID=E3MHT4_CAERE|nr:hypothetical protein CRE_24997 [Caenorhabditis remanei]
MAKEHGAMRSVLNLVGSVMLPQDTSNCSDRHDTPSAPEFLSQSKTSGLTDQRFRSPTIPNRTPLHRQCLYNHRTCPFANPLVLCVQVRVNREAKEQIVLADCSLSSELKKRKIWTHRQIFPVVCNFIITCEMLLLSLLATWLLAPRHNAMFDAYRSSMALSETTASLNDTEQSIIIDN